MIATIIDSVKVSPELGLYVVTLREQQGKQSLHVFVESDEAKAMAAALDNKAVPELRTYDLLSLVIKGLSVKVNMVVVSDCHRLEDKASLSFNAKILVVNAIRQFTIGAHAPDAIAIAIFTETPIFVEESVMDISNSDALTQARINELSWLEVKDLFESESKELPSPKELNRMLLSEEVNMTGENVELVVNEVRPATLLMPLGVVILIDKQQKWHLPIWIGKTAAHTIDNLVHNIAPSNSHQILCKVVEGCSSLVSMAFINLRNEVFRAQLVFGGGDRHFGVECSASDAVITALIANAPIYAKTSLLDIVCPLD